MSFAEKCANCFFAFVVIFLAYHVLAAWLRGVFEVTR